MYVHGRFCVSTFMYIYSVHTQKPLHGKTEHFRQRQALKRRVWAASLRLHIKPIVLRDDVGLHREQKLINWNDQASQQPVSWASASMRCANNMDTNGRQSASGSICLFLRVYKSPLPALVNKEVCCIGEKRLRSLCLAQSSTSSTDRMRERLTGQNNQTRSFNLNPKYYWTVEPFTRIFQNVSVLMVWWSWYWQFILKANYGKSLISFQILFYAT